MHLSNEKEKYKEFQTLHGLHGKKIYRNEHSIPIGQDKTLQR